MKDDRFDILLTNAVVLPMDDEHTVYPDGCVAILGDSISAVGPKESFSSARAGRVMDCRGGIVLPGLVNAHTHAAMTLFRGLADDLPLMTWLHDYIFPAEAGLTRDMVYKGTLLACAEMILSGTTTFCDMYLFEDAAARAADEAGMRAVLGEVLYDFDSPNYGPIEAGFAFTESLIQQWKGHPRIVIAVEPHTTYTCGPDLLRRSHEIAEKWDVPLVIHVSETLSEVEQISSKYGRTPVGYLDGLGFLCPRLVGDHCVVLTEDDIRLIAERDVKVSHNPESNMKLASGAAPVAGLLSAGVTVGLGTDGCASNNNLDLFGEMDSAAKLHKAVCRDATVLDAFTVLSMANRNGAKALGLSRLIGSLTPGKRADVIVVDTQKPHLAPMYNPASHLVYACRGSDVDTSIINGRVVMENRRLLTLDIERVMSDCRALARKITK